MSLCAHCGQPTLADVCEYHSAGYGGDWATGNRVMCDFVHRGIVSPTPPELTDTSIDLLVGTLEAA